MFLETSVGAQVWAGMGGFEAEGAGPVRFKSAEILGVPSGMEVLGVWAVNVAESGHSSINARGDDIFTKYRVRLHPIEDVIILPGEPYTWSLVAAARTTKPGTYRTTGLRVSWDGGSQTYEYRFGITDAAAEDVATQGEG